MTLPLLSLTCCLQIKGKAAWPYKPPLTPPPCAPLDSHQTTCWCGHQKPLSTWLFVLLLPWSTCVITAGQVISLFVYLDLVLCDLDATDLLWGACNLQEARQPILSQCVPLTFVTAI